MAKEPFIHETAVVDPGARIGEGTCIWLFSHVMPGAVIGKNCIIGQNVFVGKATVGDGCKIQNNVSVYDGIHLENDVFCGPSMVFTNVLNPRAHVERKHEFREIFVKRGATIGANATILCGTTLGAYCMIGCGSVVTKDVSDYAMMVGNPAHRIGWVCACGNRLTLNNNVATCVCGQRYRLENAEVLVVDD